MDELRGMGLGFKLILEGIKPTLRHYPDLSIIYLHMVPYNKAALNFYKKHHFKELKRHKDAYEINGKWYGSIVLWRPLDNELLDKKK